MKIEDEVEILLVDDNPQDAELALRALRKHDLASHVLWVGDGAAALEYFFPAGTDAGAVRSRTPKVIFLDLKMPRVGGLEVLRRLKGDERTRLIPVVAMTSSGERHDVLESYRLGANSYIVKPMDFDEFCKAVVQAGRYWLLLNERPTTPCR